MGLSWAEAAHDSPYGRIEVTLRLDAAQFTVHVTVPLGTSAEVVLLEGTTTAMGPGTHRLVAAAIANRQIDRRGRLFEFD